MREYKEKLYFLRHWILNSEHAFLLCSGRTRSSTMSLGPSGSSLYPSLRHADSLPLGNNILVWPVSFALLLTSYWMKTGIGPILLDE